MSARNVEVARAVYKAGNRGDWDALFAHVDADAEWESDPRVPDAGVYRGREQIQRFMEDQDEPFDHSIAELEDLIPVGDQVLALVRMRWRMQGSSAEIEARIAHLLTFRDGKLVRAQAFAERERALEAAGLPLDTV